MTADLGTRIVMTRPQLPAKLFAISMFVVQLTIVLGAISESSVPNKQ